jgi:uncharacterized protein
MSMAQKRFVRTGCLCGMLLVLCIPLQAAELLTGLSGQQASSTTQTASPPTDQDDAPATATDINACSAGDDTNGPFDDSVPTAIPELRSRVTDLTGHLSVDCMASISDRIRQLEDEKGSQVRVLIVGSTGDESIEDYANRVFHAWKLGRKGIDDGVLLVAALHDHHDRIEVGYGLEGAIPDAVAGDILRNDVRPQFAAGNFGAGVSAAVDDLSHLIRGEPLPKPAPKGKWMRWQLMVAALLLVCLGGAVGSLAQWRWSLRLALPFLIIAFVDVIGLLFHLESDWTTALAILPFAALAYAAGIFFANYPKSFLFWLGCVTGAFAIGIILIFKFAHSTEPGRMTFYELEVGMTAMFFGSFIFWLTSKNPLIGRSYSFGKSSSSSSSSGSDSDDSSSSGSDDSSGGGGDSGGGGASSDW